MQAVLFLAYIHTVHTDCLFSVIIEYFNLKITQFRYHIHLDFSLKNNLKILDPSYETYCLVCFGGKTLLYFRITHVHTSLDIWGV